MIREKSHINKDIKYLIHVNTCRGDFHRGREVGSSVTQEADRHQTSNLQAPGSWTLLSPEL